MLRVALLTSTLLALVDARVYERCELARDLANVGIEKQHLATWVCIAFHESRFDTAARNPHSGDHGLLQISELYWCGAGKACGLPCSSLRDDDISDDVACALRVHEEHTRLQGDGFLAWVVYPHHCKHNAKKYLADCDNSVKTPYLRTDERARMLKSESYNFTTTSFTYNPKIDELLPPYLTVNSLLRGSYEKEFQKNYNKNARVNWLNYKIDNIDDLKVPVFERKLDERYTTSTVTTTTTTTPSPSSDIKPPSPRRIESNSFRRRKMRPINEADNLSGLTDHPVSYTRTLPAKMVPSDLFTEKYVTEKNFLALLTTPAVSTTKTAATTTTTTVTTPLITTTTASTPSTTTFRFSSATTPTSKYFHLSFPITTKQVQTTKVPIIRGISALKTAVIPIATTKSTNEGFPSVTEKSSPNVSFITSSKNLNTATTLTNVSDSMVDNKKNISANKSPRAKSNEVTSSMDTLSTVGINKYHSFVSRKSQLPSTTTIRSRSWYTWRTPTTTTSTTSRPMTVSLTPSNARWTTLSNKFKENVTTSKQNYHTTTTKPSFNKNVSSTTVQPVQTHTIKTRTTWPGTNPRWTWASSKSPSSRTTDHPTTPSTKSINATPFSRVTENSINPSTKPVETTTSSPITARTTQSIFDLYLKSTKRPKLPAYSFPLINNKSFSLRIFADGTTTHAPTFSKYERSKTT